MKKENFDLQYIDDNVHSLEDEMKINKIIL